MAEVKPTRMGLLLTRKKLKLAQKGHKLLKQKRDVLVMEFFSVLKEIKRLREDIGDNLVNAQDSLMNAQAFEGNINIERIASAVAGGLEVSFSKKSIMGVEFPQIENIEAKHEWHGYYEQSIELDNAVLKYRELLPKILKLAERQLVLSRLAGEIQKTKRRVNSLEYIRIPRLESTKKLISFRLEELERENFSRLKMIKSAQTEA